MCYLSYCWDTKNKVWIFSSTICGFFPFPQGKKKKKKIITKSMYTLEKSYLCGIETACLKYFLFSLILIVCLKFIRCSGMEPVWKAMTCSVINVHKVFYICCLWDTLLNCSHWVSTNLSSWCMCGHFAQGKEEEWVECSMAGTGYPAPGIRGSATRVTGVSGILINKLRRNTDSLPCE